MSKTLLQWQLYHIRPLLRNVVEDFDHQFIETENTKIIRTYSAPMR